MARGRKKIELDPQEFQDKLTEFETGKQFANRGAMWDAFCDSQWAMSRQPRPLSPSVAMAKAREFNLVIQTKMGAKGVLTAENRGGERKSKKMSPKQVSAIRQDMLVNGEVDPYFERQLRLAAKGSIKATIVVHCLYCAGSKKEVSLCEVYSCPLWHLRKNPVSSTER